MSRFFSPPENVKGDKIFIEGKEAHHLLKVMRLKAGDEVVIFDGQGKGYQGVIIEERKKSAVVKILSEKKVEKLEEPRVTLAQALPARGKMDYLVEKATELGVDEIIPLETKRSVVKINKGKAELTRRRWEKISISASKQCGRLKLPVINRITKFPHALGKASEFDLVLFPCLNFKAVPLKKVLEDGGKIKKVLVFIGPEGGFSKEEIKQAEFVGCKLVALGSNVLKSDTAALAMLSIIKMAASNKEKRC